MWNSIIKLLNRTNITKKMFIFVIFLIFIPVIVINSIFIWQINAVNQKRADRTYENTLSGYVGNFEYKMSIYDTVLNNIISNGVIQDVLVGRDNYENLDRVLISGKLRTEFNNSNAAKVDIKRLTIYVVDNRFPVDGICTLHVDNVKNDDWFLKLENNNIKSNVLVYSMDTVSIVRKIYNLKTGTLNDKIGYMRLDIDATKLLNFEHNSSVGESNVAVLTDKNEVIYQSGTSDIHKIVNTEKLNLGEYIKCSSDVMVTRNKNGLIFALFFDKTFMSHEIKSLYIGIVLMNLLLAAMIITAIQIFSKTFTSRILFINDKMKKSLNNDLSIAPLIDGNDEIAQMDNTFNQMLERILKLINENYAAELEKKNLQLRALQFQINPHFLYNTLELISQMGVVHDCKDISLIAQKLGSIFRYNIDISTDFVPLSDEILHIQNYLAIQKIRYEDKFEIYYDIEQECYQCKMLKFILQPIVENALYHGLYPQSECGILEINAFLNDGNLYITIMDNGAGIEDEKLNNFMEDLKNNDIYYMKKNYGKSIGLKNVDSRIKLLYGIDYGISIKSSKGLGTKITIKMPIIIEERL